jgi:hypothetical protein
MPKVIKAIDRVGRVTMNQLYEELVKAGKVEDTVLNRADFIGQMGEYNKRLQGKWTQMLKEKGLSPFIVAGKNFNAMGLRALIGHPGVRAINSKAMTEMAVQNMLAAYAAELAVPYAWNLYNKGEGQPSDTRKGYLSVGQSDVDLSKYKQFKRGGRQFGLQGLREGMEKDWSSWKTGWAMASEAGRTALHPYAGPGVQAALIFLTGKDLTGFTRSEVGPENRAQAALENINPVLTSGAHRLAGAELTSKDKSISGAFSAAAGVVPKKEETAKKKTKQRYSIKEKKRQ